jgi:hypothetical protein
LGGPQSATLLIRRRGGRRGASILAESALSLPSCQAGFSRLLVADRPFKQETQQGFIGDFRWRHTTRLTTASEKVNHFGRKNAKKLVDG